MRKGAMEWLNYHHLYYFWHVAREGSVTAASKKLRLAPSTVSTQVKTLEERLGVTLFTREGRRLRLTESGRHTLSYCDEIFGLGQELVATLRHPDPQSRRPVHLRVGVADILHKWVAHRVLDAARQLDQVQLHLSCHSDHTERLVADLATHSLDLVLTDAPVGLAGEPTVESESLAALDVCLMGTASLIEKRRGVGPAALQGAPMLLPSPGTALRRSLERWFDARGIVPWVVAEFGDSALMKAFGRDGAGLFPVPVAVSAEVCAVYGVEVCTYLEEVTERVYLVRPRRAQHPLLARFLTAARASLAHS